MGYDFREDSLPAYFGAFDEEERPSLRRQSRHQLYRDLMNRQGPVTQESPTETASLTALEQLSQRLASGQGPEAETFALGRNTLADVLAQAGPNFEQFFQSSVQDPLMRSFGQEIIPTAQAALGKSGFYGSAMGDEVNRATGDLTRALASARGRMGVELLNTRLTGAGMAPGLAAPEAQLMAGLLSVGDYRRQKELERIKLLMQLQSPSGSFAPNGGPSEGRQNSAAALRIGGTILGGILGGPAGAAGGATVADTVGGTSGGVVSGSPW